MGRPHDDSIFILTPVDSNDHEVYVDDLIELGYFASREEAQAAIDARTAAGTARYAVYCDEIEAANTARQVRYEESFRRVEVLRANGFPNEQLPAPPWMNRAESLESFLDDEGAFEITELRPHAAIEDDRG